MEKYQVTNGRFAMGDKVYEHGEIVELNDSEVKRLTAQGIITDTLEKFVEEKVEEKAESKKSKKSAPKVPKSSEE